MSTCGKRLMTIAATIGVAAIARAQQPFDLDLGFVTTIGSQGVGSIALLDDGDLLLSGSIRFPNDQEDRNTARLNPDGSRDVAYPLATYGGGKLVAWNGRFYVGNGQGIRRIWPDGVADMGFAGLNLDPYIQLLQGGDYHVFPDGRLLITGTHGLSDTVRGYVGLYNLIWITAEGRLDTTRVHRKSNGDLSRMRELPDGKFIIGGGISQYEGHPVGNIIRVLADGSLDTTFHSTAEWFWPLCYHALPDGKVLCGGDVVFSGSDDTLHVFRLLPDGALDPTFNNTLAMWRSYDLDGKAVVSSINPLGADKYIITGAFDRVEGQYRGGIAVIDTSGQLLDTPIGEAGCGTYWDGFSTQGFIVGIEEAPDGAYYVFGAYHGYDDGTTDDGSQRMVSRLYGLDVGVEEAGATRGGGLVLYPNPASERCTVSYEPRVTGGLVLRLMDATGRMLWSVRPGMTEGQVIVDLRGYAPGSYTVQLSSAGAILATQKLMIKE